jgi:hypothetical protein
MELTIKQRINKWITACILLSLTTCGSYIKVVQIDIQQPAKVTLPLSAQKVVVVNNAIPQRLTDETTYKDKSIDSAFIKTFNNAPWTAVNTISSILGKSNFFNEVSYYDIAVRKDNNWLGVIPLEKNVKENLFESEGFDVIVSIDRLLFHVIDRNKEIRSHKYFSKETSRLMFMVALNASIYLKDKEEPLTTTLMMDSLLFTPETADYFQYYYFNSSFGSYEFKSVIEMVLMSLTGNVAERTASELTPTWETVGRFLYKNANMMTNDLWNFYQKKWTDVESSWKTTFENKTKPNEKAQMALNVALVLEMQNKLDEALLWVEKAKTYFSEEKSSKFDKEKKYTNEYIISLKKRIEDDKILNVQLGVE